jgi:hypothetical protein
VHIRNWPACRDRVETETAGLVLPATWSETLEQKRGRMAYGRFHDLGNVVPLCANCHTPFDGRRYDDVREPPKTVRARINYLLRQMKSAKAVAAELGITVETSARFGYTAPIGTTDDGRMRRLTVHLPPEYANRLFDAQQQGASRSTALVVSRWTSGRLPTSGHRQIQGAVLRPTRRGSPPNWTTPRPSPSSINRWLCRTSGGDGR